jgi:hypothetical protein
LVEQKWRKGNIKGKRRQKVTFAAFVRKHIERKTRSGGAKLTCHSVWCKYSYTWKPLFGRYKPKFKKKIKEKLLIIVWKLQVHLLP